MPTPTPTPTWTVGRSGAVASGPNDGRASVVTSGITEEAPGITESRGEGSTALGAGGVSTATSGADGVPTASGAGGVPTASGAGCSSAGSLHVQLHTQLHVQLSGVPLCISVASDVVSPQNVNVQFQDQGPDDSVSVVVSTAPALVVLVDGALWATAPSCPGLSTRTETCTFPSLELVEVVTSDAPIRGGGRGSVHDQSHAQSHVQSIDDGLPDSSEEEVVIPAQSVANFQLQCHGSGGAASVD